MASSVKDQSVSNLNGECSTDIEDVEEIYSLMNAKNRKPDHKKLERNKLELEKYYEGEQHQSGRHVVVIVSQVLVMIVVSALL